jgi:hypothetical protein
MVQKRLLAMPFETQFSRDIHFQKHGHKFGAVNAIQYENMADNFMFGAMTMSMAECIRANAIDRLRYNYMNRHLGVASVAPVFVRTFYPVPQHTVAHHGGAASFFTYECGR